MKVYSYQVIPSLPDELEGLRDLAYNLFWSWDNRIVNVFRRIDPELWKQTRYNPVKLLGQVSQRRLDELSVDEGFIAYYKRALEDLRNYHASTTWYDKSEFGDKDDVIAYFSPEFGIAPCLPIYAGGLGVLAGDHTKSASDLGIPLVGIGLLYQQGYFRQYLNIDGWQQESFPENDFYNLPLELVLNDDSGEPLRISVNYPEGEVFARIWKLCVGRVKIYLLDTNIPDNASSISRDITDQLYGGDTEHRIRQEIMLGIGGVRALSALGIPPSCFHINEGHAGFLALERCRILIEEQGLSFAQARILVGGTSIFTTHTPVPAGIDTFDPELVEKYFDNFYPQLGLSSRDFLALGRQNPDDSSELFNMAYMSLRFSDYCNGVSKLHGEVTRNVWRNRWVGLPVAEVPITSITNGIHTHTWLSEDMDSLLTTYLGPRWRKNPADSKLWDQLEQIPNEELWSVHNKQRERLVGYIRSKLSEDLKRRGAPPAEIDTVGELLNPNTLTIGFARRFATYKRATLIFKDVDRLRRLLLDTDKPIQLVFAGKAHPSDDNGKEFIKQLIHFIRDPQLRRRIVFLEDYDITVAQMMISGVDVWLNTPRRPREASGTSGMKAAVNGALNLSIPDGWWIEGFEPDTGWSIGKGEEYEDFAYQDLVESNSLYDLIEGEIAPLFYQRDTNDLPRGWIEMMKSSMRKLIPAFSSHRMVEEYATRFYFSAIKNHHRFIANDHEVVRDLADWEGKIEREWQNIVISDVRRTNDDSLSIGDGIEISATLELGNLSPDDVVVQIYYGVLESDMEIKDGTCVNMDMSKPNGGSEYIYTGTIPCDTSGRNGYTIRVLPHHPELISSYNIGLIKWYE